MPRTPATTLRPSCRGEFKIAIVCALPEERNAVEDVMTRDYKDDDEPPVYRRAEGDTNVYGYGELGGEPVVLACMADMGSLAASEVVRDLHRSFRNLSIVFLVGITGGAPFQADGSPTGVRVGDIVISSSMLKGDLGKQLENRFDTTNDFDARLPRAAEIVRKTLVAIKNEGGDFRRLVKKTNIDLTAHPRLKHKKYQCPGRTTDHIYASDHRHKHHNIGECDVCSNCHTLRDPVCDVAEQSSCQTLGCQPIALDDCGRREFTDQAWIHVGPYVSTDGVMKSAHRRDQLVILHNALAIEIEGPGVWGSMPTMVVKGVVDYADSHKNKTWRLYPAARAALCTKAIIELMELELSEAAPICPARSNPALQSHIIGGQTTGQHGVAFEGRRVATQDEEKVEEIGRGQFPPSAAGRVSRDIRAVNRAGTQARGGNLHKARLREHPSQDLRRLQTQALTILSLFLMILEDWLQRRLSSSLINSLLTSAATFEDAHGNVMAIDLNFVSTWRVCWPLEYASIQLTGGSQAFECSLRETFAGMPDQRGLQRIIQKQYRLHDGVRDDVIDPNRLPSFRVVFATGRHVRMSIYFDWDDFNQEACPNCGLSQATELGMETVCDCGLQYRILDSVSVDLALPDRDATGARFSAVSVSESIDGSRDRPGDFQRISMGNWPETAIKADTHHAQLFHPNFYDYGMPGALDDESSLLFLQDHCDPIDMTQLTDLDLALWNADMAFDSCSHAQVAKSPGQQSHQTVPGSDSLSPDDASGHIQRDPRMTIWKILNLPSEGSGILKIS